MNNFNQKNVILSFSKVMSMPYGQYYNVQLPQQDIEDYHELFDGDINNAYTQLVDNDLYIENKLKYNTEYTEGLKANDYDSIRLGENGYKFAQDDDGVINFYRKVETDLSASLQTKTITDAVNYLTSFGQRVYCGTDAGVAVYEYTRSDASFGYEVYGKSPCSQMCNGRLVLGLDRQVMVVQSDLSSAVYHDVVADGIYYAPKAIQYTSVRQTSIIVCDDGRTILSAKVSNSFTAKDITPNLSSSTVSINDVLVVNTSNVSFDLILLTNNGLYRSTDSSYVNYMPVCADELAGRNVFKSKDCGSAGIVLFTDIGLYGYSEQDASVYKMSGNSVRVNDVAQYYQENGKTKYLGVAEDEIKMSYNLRRWYDFMDVSGDVEFTQIYVIGKKDLVFGSDRGIYLYKNGYDTVRDSIRFTEENIYQMYSDNDSYIEGEMQSCMDRHVSESHQPGSTYQKINDDYIDADMEMLCAFTSPEKQLGVELSSAQYDYVYKIVSDSTANNDDVQVYVKNFATGNEYTPVEAFYTVKLWKSGFNEFNIYVPTTKTYYLNHIAGAPMCDVQPQKALYRKNLKSVNLANQQISAQQTSEMSSHYTDIVVSILSTQYDIENLLNVSIRGNSLPLGIYKDTTNAESHVGSTSRFHSFIEPSMMFSDYDISKTNKYEKYEFHGCCFGTDAQAIQLLTTTKTTHYYDGNMLSVVYHGNRRYTSQHMETYIQKLRLGENNELSAWRIAGTRFNGNSADDYFYGWSTLENPEDNNTDIDVKKEGDTIYLTEFKKKSVMHLYATWVSINWNASHTEIDVYQDATS